MARWLDRPRILAEGTCFEVASILLVNAILAVIVDEDASAVTLLDTAEFYLEEAIRRDDLGNYRKLGQTELARSQRLRDLAIVRWIRDRQLNPEDFRAACAMKEQWNHAIFSKPDWRDTGFHLYEWMAEQIVLDEFQKAKDIADRYGVNGHALGRGPEAAFALVAEAQLTPNNAELRKKAEAAVDSFYRGFTKWAPGFRENEVPYDQKLLYSYVRGHFFKDVHDPVRLIKMMRFSE